jgi:hypothetical protein
MIGAKGLALLLALAAAGEAVQQPASPPFRTGVELVTVDALVTSGGRPVAGCARPISSCSTTASGNALTP